MNINRIWYLAVTAFSLSSGCNFDLVKERAVDLVIPCEVCIEAEHNVSSADFHYETTVSLGSEIDEVLDDFDVKRDDIKQAKVVSVRCAVIDLDGTQDWTLTGEAEVMYGGDWHKLLEYQDLSLRQAIEDVQYLSLSEVGVGIVNQAIEEYLDGAMPTLGFELTNNETNPDPTPENPLRFTWEFCIEMHIVANAEVEVIDPF